MARVKTARTTRARHKKILKQAKGYYGAKSYRFRNANQAVMKSLAYAYVGRKDKKSNFRKLWIARINAAARMNGTTYSKMIAGLKKANVTLDKINAIAVTYGAGLMGALMVGVNFAQSLAYALNIPLIKVNHIKGHISANYLACPELKPPFISLVVSGGQRQMPPLFLLIPPVQCRNCFPNRNLRRSLSARLPQELPSSKVTTLFLLSSFISSFLFLHSFFVF